MKGELNQSGGMPRPGSGEQRRGAERVDEVAERARATAIEKVEHARDRTREQIDENKRAIADRIRRVGGALRSASETLHEGDRVVARYAGLASDTAERAAGYIASTDFKSMVRDVEGLARRQPALLLRRGVPGRARGRALSPQLARTERPERRARV